MKRIMWKYFTANNTNKYKIWLTSTTLHIPSDARDPSNVCSLNYKHVFTALYGKITPPPPPAKYHVAEKVRVTRKKDTFEKGFTPNCTEEVFTVSEVKHTNPITYSVKAELGEPIKGTFYE